MIINLYDETVDVLKNNGLSIQNIKYISNMDGFISIATYTHLSKNIYYNNIVECGERPVVDTTIKIVGSNWWLEREIHKNTECWGFHKKPSRPTIEASNATLLNSGLSDKMLSIIQQHKEEGKQ